MRAATPRVERSTGIPIAPGFGYTAGGGYNGATDELDAIVSAAADALSDLYGMDVVIRFNSDRASGGAWLRTHEVDAIGANAEIGIGASTMTQRVHDNVTRWRAEGEDWPEPAPVGTITIYAHIGESSLLTPEIAPDGMRYVHTPVDSIAAALALVLEHGRVPDSAR